MVYFHYPGKLGPLATCPGIDIWSNNKGSFSDPVGSVGSVDLVLGEVPQNITTHFRPLAEGV